MPSRDARREAVASHLADGGISADLVGMQEFRDRYRIFRGPQSATLDVLYDSKERITGVESGSAKGSPALIIDAIGRIEGLPDSFLRPRFAERAGSPAQLAPRHLAALESAGLTATGLRIAQYQLMYDVEAADATGQTDLAHIRVCYDRDGNVTSLELGASSLAERAIEALGLTGIGRRRSIGS